jgi:hypothetical protein
MHAIARVDARKSVDPIILNGAGQASDHVKQESLYGRVRNRMGS